MSTLTTLNTDNPFTLPISASNYRSFTLDFNFDGRILAGLETCGVKLDHMIAPPIVGEEGSHREILNLTTVQSTISQKSLEDTPFTLSELCFIARSRLPLLTVDSLAHAINTLISEAYTNTTPSTQASSLSPSQLRQLFTNSLLEPPTRTTPFAPSALFARRPRPHVPHAAFTLQAPLSLSTPPELPRIFCAAPQALQEMGLAPGLVSQHIFDEAPASTTATTSSAAQPSQRTSEDLAAPSKALAALLAGHNPGFTLCAAHRYCGHQFGVWASQLGDGAAMTVAMLAMPTKDVDKINMGDDNLDNVSHADALVSSLTPTVASAILSSSSSSEASHKVLNSLDAPALQKLSSTVAAGLAPHALLYPMNMLIPVKTVVDNNTNPSVAVKNDLCINDAHSAPYLDAHFKRWLHALTSTPNNASPSTSTPNNASPSTSTPNNASPSTSTPNNASPSTSTPNNNKNTSPSTSTPSTPTPASLPTILHPTRPKALPLELQYKGSGLTTFSRSADGRKVLRSSLREHIGSASMHALGVPTTESPSLAIGQDAVMRDQFYRGQPKMESCAVITRTAPTFLRFGSLETGRLRDGLKHVAVPRSLLGDQARESASAAEADESSTSSKDGAASVIDVKSGLKSTLPLTSATGPIETLCYLLAAVYTDVVDDYVANFWRLHSEKDAREAVHSVYWDKDAGKPRNLPQQLHEHLLTSLNGEFIPTSTPTWPRPRQYVPAPPITDNPIPASIQATLPLSSWFTNPLWQQWREHSSSELQQPSVPLTLWDWRVMVMQVAARVAAKTGALTAQWQSVGYVHGVLNTDNISLAGVTIDYGPFGINHQFDFFRIPNTSDSEGRYRYSEQRAINLWNMGKLREALMSTPLPIEAIEKHSWSKLSGSCDITAEAKIWLLEQVAQQDPKFPPIVDPAADNFYNLEEAPEEGWLGPLVQIPENYLASVYEQSYESVETHVWAGKLGLRSASDVAANGELIPHSENQKDIPNNILHAVSIAQGSVGFMSNPDAEQSGPDQAAPLNPVFTDSEKHFPELSGIPNPRFQTLQSLAMWSENFRDVCRQGLVSENTSENTSASARDSSAYGQYSLRNVDTPLSPSLLAITNALIEEINATHGHYTRQNIPPTSSSSLSTSSLTTAMITAIDRALVLLLQLTMHIAGSEAPLALRHIAEQSSMLSEWGQSMLQSGKTENSEMFSRLNTTLDELVKLGLRSGELRGLAQSLIPSDSKEELEEMREKLQELLVLRPQLKEAVLAKLREVDSVMLRWRIYDSYGPVVSSEDNSILGAPVCSLRGKVVKNADDNASTSTPATALTGTSYRNDKAARDRALWTEWLRLYAMRLAVDEISLYNLYTASTSSPSHASANNSDSQPQDIIPFDVFVDVYRSLRSSSQRAHTPVHLPRNVLLEEAIRAAEEENDDVCVRALLTVLSDPYDLGLCDIEASAKQKSGEALPLVAGALSPCPDIYRDFSRDIFRAWVSHFREELRKRSTKSDYEICVSCSS